jgi:hypothetical protein
MNANIRTKIANLVRQKIQEKLLAYEAETDYVPFFTAIFDRETILKASLMQSLYTTFGMSIYEQMAVILAQSKGWHAERQYALRGEIDSVTENLIDQLCRGSTHNKQDELDKIRASTKSGKPLPDHEGTVDIYIRKPDGSELMVDITTVKPNLKEFKSMRKKMLRWASLRYSTNKKAQIDTRIGIPYNPYYPKPYDRWTSAVCDPKGDLLVQHDLWHAFAGEDVFEELLSVFEEVGQETKAEIRAFINKRC